MANKGRLLSCWCPMSNAQTSPNGQCQLFEKQSPEPVPSTNSTNCCPLAPWTPLRPHSHFTGLRSQNPTQLWHAQIRFRDDAWDTWVGWCSWYGWGGWGGWGGCWAEALGAFIKREAAKLEGSHVLKLSRAERRLSTVLTVLVFLVALREPGWTTAQAHINQCFCAIQSLDAAPPDSNTLNPRHCTKMQTSGSMFHNNIQEIDIEMQTCCEL